MDVYDESSYLKWGKLTEKEERSDGFYLRSASFWMIKPLLNYPTTARVAVRSLKLGKVLLKGYKKSVIRRSFKTWSPLRHKAVCYGSLRSIPMIQPPLDNALIVLQYESGTNIFLWWPRGSFRVLVHIPDSVPRILKDRTPNSGSMADVYTPGLRILQ